MRTPAIVIAAALAEPVFVGGCLIEPHTLRRHFQLEAARSPFLSPDPATADLAATVAAVGIFDRTLAGLDLDRFTRICRPEDVAAVGAAIRASIALGFSTALTMCDAPTQASAHAAASHPAPKRDVFGPLTALWAYAVKRLTMPPDLALDMPMCQLWVLTAASEAMDGKMPSGADYYEISRSIGPVVPIHAVAAEGEANRIQQTVDGDKTKDEPHSSTVA
jgi:hypothetical protein